jgi:hypothetical protein
MAYLYIPEVNNRFVVRAIRDVILLLLVVASSGVEAAHDGTGTARSSVILQDQASWKNPSALVTCDPSALFGARNHPRADVIYRLSHG